MFGQILGSIAGGILADRSAKRQSDAINAANEANNRGYTDARPYVTDIYSRGNDALDDILNKGYYTGNTYAGMNPLTTQGYNNMGSLGQQGYSDAVNFMNIGQGFGQNYSNLYNQASGNTLSNAQAYATNPANYQGLVDSALRDSRRNLEENTLRGIDIAASGSGNANSSRAGVADAIAARGFADREADTRAAIQNRLQQDYMKSENDRFANMTTANNNLGTLYNTGFNQGNVGNNMMVNAGKGFQLDEQNRMNDDRARFEGERDFEMDAYNNFMSGILGQAPRTPSGYQVNSVDRLGAALGGMQAGAGFGGQIMNYFSPQAAAPTPTPTPVNPMYRYGSRGMGFGNNPYGF